MAKTVTDASGRFKFTRIAPGTYALFAEKSTFKPGIQIISLGDKQAPPIVLTLQSQQALSMAVVAQRLERSQNELSPKTGGSQFTFSEKALKALPEGNNTALNDVLLQAPGVAQDSFGQVHVRGEHANLQYRINGVQLPDGITGFGQVLTPRLAQSMSLLTGALPAEFGLRTAGIIDITTKTGFALNGGDLDMYGGQRGTLQPSFQLGGTKGKFDYFVTGQFMQNDRGIEPPTPGPEAINDFTQQGQGFGYFSYLISPTQKLTLLTGVAVNSFQIPANPGQPPAYKLAGVGNYPSADVSESQFEQNYFGVLAYQGAVGPRFTYQLAGFSRYSTLQFNPDPIGDLIYNGIASNVFRSDWGNGIQIDTAYRLNLQHTLRAGIYFNAERAEIDNHSMTFPVTLSAPADVPVAITDNNALQTWEYSVYVQDEWRLLPNLTFNYGVRFDLYDGLDRADQASPRAAVVYKPFRYTTLHAGYARYFTPPPTEMVSVGNINKFLHTTGAPPSFGSSTPSPERAHYFDVGAQQEVVPRLNLGVDSYYKKSTDLIDEGQFGAALVYSPFNYAKGRVYGVEATATYDIGEILTSYLNFAYSVAQGTNVESGQFNFTPDELSYIATHYVFLDHDQTFTASGGATYSWRGFNFLFDGIYGSGLRSGFANTGNLPFYVQLNAGITKQINLSNWNQRIAPMEVRIACVNVLDWIYQIRNGTGIGVFAPQYGPRRAFYGGLKWDLPFIKPAGIP
jgi:outer membrane receptor protein involved in Fe transport